MPSSVHGRFSRAINAERELLACRVLELLRGPRCREAFDNIYGSKEHGLMCYAFRAARPGGEAARLTRHTLAENARCTSTWKPFATRCTLTSAWAGTRFLHWCRGRAPRGCSAPGVRAGFSGGPASWPFLLFLPNSAYTLTDVIHLVYRIRREPHVPVWTVALVLMPQYAAFMVAGWQAHVLSLMRCGDYLRSLGRGRWVVPVEIVLNLLVAAGIYFGRFQRFNSWDIVSQPEKLALTTIEDFTRRNPLEVVAVTFGVLIVLYYVSKIVDRALIEFATGQQALVQLLAAGHARLGGGRLGLGRSWLFLAAARSLPATSASSSLRNCLSRLLDRPTWYDLNRAVLADQHGLWNRGRLIIATRRVPALSSAIFAVTPFCSAKCCTSAAVSSRFTAYSTTPFFLNSEATFSICGIATMQGPHQVAQKSRMTTFFPFKAARSSLPPPRRSILIAGAGVPNSGCGGSSWIGRIVDLDAAPFAGRNANASAGQDRVLLPILVRRDATNADVRWRGLTQCGGLLRQRLVQIGNKLP